jgi:aspartyl-tRNA(Asn)/glutamyl-tRNA(Gln) amidotransferase subunit A
MVMTEPTHLTLVEAAEAVRAREISARELASACIERSERLQPVLNTFINPDFDGALAEADAIDAAIARGEEPGPLAGVPLAHKDMYYRAGKVTTCGSKIRRDFRPDHSATVLERLGAAGGLYLGGLNMAEFAVGPTGHNVHFGACRNPWNTDHMPGGSSSGSGSATAARLVFGALGSDTGGSVRLPAAACGVVGLKPTQTRISRRGVMGLCFSLDNVGPLARTVRDCARLARVIAGHDPDDPTSSHHPVPDYEAATLRPEVAGLRIGVPTRYYYDDLDDEVRACLEASLRVYADLGAEVVEVAPPDHEYLSDLMGAVMTSEAATLHQRWLAERPQDYGPQVLARIQPGLACPATRYLQALQVRHRLLARFVEAVFGGCDVLHLPVLAMPVPTLAETDVGDSPRFPEVIGRITRNTRTISYLGLPSLATPAGFTASGLPAAFQLVGPPFAEARLFRVAAAYEAATGWPSRAPELPSARGGQAAPA